MEPRKDEKSEDINMNFVKKRSFISSACMSVAIGIQAVPTLSAAEEVNAFQWQDNLSLGDSALGVYEGEAPAAVGKRNTALGLDTMMFAGTKDDNTAVGYRAMKTNAGKANTLIGAYAGGSGPLTSNDNNTGVGYRALASNQASNNTAVGYAALADGANIGANNVAVGSEALQNNFHGAENTVIGYRAGGQNSSGNKNVFIGFRAGDSATYSNKSNVLMIANGPAPANQLIMGNFAYRSINLNGRVLVGQHLSVKSDVRIGGTLNVKSSASAKSFNTTSDARLKENIQPLENALESIMRLSGKSYDWKGGDGVADIGLIAQDVESVFPELVITNDDGFKAIAYSRLTAVLVEAIKQQQAQLRDQAIVISELTYANEALQARVTNDIDRLLARVAFLEGEPLAQVD